MTVVAVMSQPLRQREAAFYLSSIEDVDRRLLITKFENEVDLTLFPEGTELVAWAPNPKPPPSRRVVSWLDRLKYWIRQGSWLGLRLERWLRSADWRLRYLDRLFALAHSTKRRSWDLKNPYLVNVLQSRGPEGITEIAVFDLFDLPAVLLATESAKCFVAVR